MSESVGSEYRLQWGNPQVCSQVQHMTQSAESRVTFE